MLHASHNMPTFVRAVGVAPSTTTMTIPASRSATSVRGRRQGKDPISRGGAAGGRRTGSGYYIPYQTIEDLKSSGGLGSLGIINETDAWLTGRPYGLPGTATVRLTRRADGVDYASTMVGGGFGDATSVDATTAALQQLATTQQQQQQSLDQIATWMKWTALASAAGMIFTVAIGIARGATK